MSTKKFSDFDPDAKEVSPGVWESPNCPEDKVYLLNVDSLRFVRGPNGAIMDGRTQEQKLMSGSIVNLNKKDK